MVDKPRLLVFASGTKEGGGSGFDVLAEHWFQGELEADIVGVVSNHPHGGVKERADRLGVPFIFFRGPSTEANYAIIARETRANFVALSGWLKLVRGLDPRTTFNIHPGPLPRFGGPGMYGHHVHEAVMAAYRQGDVTSSAVSMHFVTERYDEGPVFFRCPVLILPDDTPDTLAARVNDIEHRLQWWATNHVVSGRIRWDGVNPGSLVVPQGTTYLVEAAR